MYGFASEIPTIGRLVVMFAALTIAGIGALSTATQASALTKVRTEIVQIDGGAQARVVVIEGDASDSYLDVSKTGQVGTAGSFTVRDLGGHGLSLAGECHWVTHGIGSNFQPYAACPAANAVLIKATLGGGRDQARVDGAVDVKVKVDAGPGWDVVTVETRFPVDLLGGDDNDRLTAGSGGGSILGGAGNDTLVGGAGIDALKGGLGDDVLSGRDSLDTLEGQEGDDSLRGGFGGDFLFGGLDDDRLKADDGNDYLEGGLGRDLFVAGNGNDRIAARDGQRDRRILCGTGIDTGVADVLAPAIDTKKYCEF